MIEIISIFILMFIIFIVLFWLKKTLFLFGFFFKLIMLLLLLSVVGSLFFGYLVVKDANDFKNNFGNSTSMMIVKYTANTSDAAATTSFLAGVKLNPEKKTFDSMTKKELLGVQKLYEDDKLPTLGKDYYKVFIIDLKSFDEVKLYNISDQNIELSREEIKSIMLSDNAREDLAKLVAKKSGRNTNDVLKELAATDEQVKGYLLSYYLSTVFNPDNMTTFLAQLKSDNIKVYTNTALFKAIKLVPQVLVNNILSEKNTSVKS